MAARITRLSLYLLFFIALFSSCYYDVEDELYQTINCDLPETVSYELDIAPLVNNNCATSSCHSSSGLAPGNFSNFDGLKQVADNGSLNQVVLQEQSMPPSGPLAPCDQQLIKKWIDEGATNN